MAAPPAPSQQSPHTPGSTAHPVQNSPCSQPSRVEPVQNSPNTPKMALFDAFGVSRENFVPLEPPTTRAGRTLYRIRDHVRDKTLPAGGSGGLTRYKTLPTHRKTPILGHLTPAGRTLYRSSHQQPEQGELYPACTSWPRCRWAAAGPALSKIRMQFDCMNFQQSPETLQFQRYEFKV